MLSVPNRGIEQLENDPIYLLKSNEHLQTGQKRKFNEVKQYNKHCTIKRHPINVRD